MADRLRKNRPAGPARRRHANVHPRRVGGSVGQPAQGRAAEGIVCRPAESIGCELGVEDHDATMRGPHSLHGGMTRTTSASLALVLIAVGSRLRRRRSTAIKPHRDGTAGEGRRSMNAAYPGDSLSEAPPRVSATLMRTNPGRPGQPPARAYLFPAPINCTRVCVGVFHLSRPRATNHRDTSVS